MANYSDLSTEQLIGLLRAQMLSEGPPTVSGGDIGAGPVRGNISTFEGPSGSALMGGGAANLPTDYGTLSLGGGGAVFNRPTGGEYSGSGQLGYSAGPLSLSYGQAITPGGRVQNYGGGLKLGDVQLGYQRSAPTSGPGANMYSLAFPLGNVSLQGQMMRPDVGPTSYQAGAMIPGLLGGNFEVTGQYTPETKDKAVFARFKRKF